jgi:protein-tyrosine phosphatase
VIDIHSHILPGLDDGAPDRDESIRMLRMAAISGTTDIVATPHANTEFQYDPGVVKGWIRDLQALEPTPRIHRGCDFHLQYELIQDALANPGKYTINGKGYLLVEFSDLTIFNNSEDVLDRLHNAGMTPIVTHPERNELLRQRMPRLRNWIENGVLLQVTAGSVLGRFGTRAREAAFEMMDRNMVHFIASDAHDTKRRPPVLKDAYLFIEKRWGAERARRLCVANPKAAIEGGKFEPGEITDKPARKWFMFWAKA